MNLWLPEIVAPHVGAWIETITKSLPCGSSWVAPHVGAWIETALGDGLLIEP